VNSAELNLVASFSAVHARDAFSLLLLAHVSADSTAALVSLMRRWLQLGLALGASAGWQTSTLLLRAALNGENALLESKLRELKLDASEALRLSEGLSLLEALITDPQMPDQATHKSSIDMRPLCSFLALGLDPTAITPPHSASPLQRARQQVKAMSDKQIMRLEQRLKQLTAWTALQAAGSSTKNHDAVDELIAFKRLHPCRLDEEWTKRWDKRCESLSLAFAIEIDRKWASHSARMRQLLLNDSTLLSSFGSFTRDLTPIICAFVGADLERPLPDDAAAGEAAADQSTDAESDATKMQAQSSEKHKEAQ